MAKVEQNIEIHRAASYEVTVTCVQEDGVTPLNVTGLALHYRIAAEAGGATVVSMSRPTITNSAAVVTIPLLTVTTAALTQRTYFHELYMVNDGERYVLMQGAVTVLPSQASKHA